MSDTLSLAQIEIKFAMLKSTASMNQVSNEVKPNRREKNLYPNSLTPFFQTVIFKTGENFSLEKIQSTIGYSLRQTEEDPRHYIRLEWSNIIEDSLLLHLIHKSIPSWLANHQVNRSVKELFPLENLGHELVIIYPYQGYLFVFCSSKTIWKEIYKALRSLDPTEVELVRPEQIYKILYYKDPTIRSLGMENIFRKGYGGTAPEAKAYFHRDTQQCLTRTFDSGYGFSYCIAATDEGTFGCAPDKRKIWTSWVHGLDEFKEECKDLSNILLGKQPDSTLRFLVVPAEITDYNSLKPVAFFLDYSVQNKGMVGVEINGVLYLDWCCYLSEKKKNQIEFSPNRDSDEVILINLSFDENSKSWMCSYNDPEQTVKVFHVREDSSQESGRRKDLVEYMNRQGHFTLIFSEGIAYRNDSYWSDDRFSVPFLDARTSISWDGVDKMAESKRKPQEGRIRISERVAESLKKDDDLQVVVLDDGANEVADFVAVGSRKLILVHVKGSAKPISGLRITDMQVVNSQALKNLPFFWKQPYSDHIFDRLFRNIIHNPRHLGKESFKQLLQQALNNPDTERECWIVQPGISKTKLDRSSKHRLHSLLIFTQGICTASNLRFKFYCSED